MLVLFLAIVVALAVILGVRKPQEARVEPETHSVGSVPYHDGLSGRAFNRDMFGSENSGAREAFLAGVYRLGVKHKGEPDMSLWEPGTFCMDDDEEAIETYRRGLRAGLLRNVRR